VKKKYVGLSYESDDGVWNVEPDGDKFDLHYSDKEWMAGITVAELISLKELITAVLAEIGADEPVQISNMGTSFVPTKTMTLDHRFHPDPDGVMGL
jgi:hypothetical protein